MSSKKKYEYREKKNFNRESDGLKQRRLKDESRWKFNPNSVYDAEEEDDDWLDEPEFDRR
jgi:hypothetical protein